MNQEQGLNADAVFNNDFYCISTFSGYGLVRSDPDAEKFTLAPECSNEALGLALQTALSVSKVIDPDDTDCFDCDKIGIEYEKWMAKIMEDFNYKNKRAMFKNMLRCDVRQLKGMITIGPSVHDRLNSGSGNGIAESYYVIIPNNSTHEEIGAALRLAFSRCKNKM